VRQLKIIVTRRQNLALKKQKFKDDKIPIFDEACVYKRGEYWQFRVWLTADNTYVQKSLNTKIREAAFRSPMIPKVVAAYDDRFLYMSRAPVPSNKNHKFRGAMHQVCVIALIKKCLTRSAQ
jgi:CMP-2-keto-3-deoxyoctulosonic acid synthetase